MEEPSIRDLNDKIGKNITHTWVRRDEIDYFDCPKHGRDNYNLITKVDLGPSHGKDDYNLILLVACGPCIIEELKRMMDYEEKHDELERIVRDYMYGRRGQGIFIDSANKWIMEKDK